MSKHLCYLLLALLAGCSGAASDSNQPASAPAADAAQQLGEIAAESETPPAEAASHGDFSTPTVAVKTFIAAAAARDAEILSRCFDESAPGEFAKLRDKSASQEDLDGLAMFVDGAQVMEERIEPGEMTAVVSVKLQTRDEEFKLAKTADGWKIVDF
jgi:hypothetical protein